MNFTLNNIETDYHQQGDASEYENPQDRFVVWATVDFDLGDTNYSESVVFDCGQREDVAMWESIDSDLLDSDGEIGAFLEDCLNKAGKELSELKASLI